MCELYVCMYVCITFCIAYVHANTVCVYIMYVRTYVCCMVISLFIHRVVYWRYVCLCMIATRYWLAPWPCSNVRKLSGTLLFCLRENQKLPYILRTTRLRQFIPCWKVGDVWWGNQCHHNIDGVTYSIHLWSEKYTMKRRTHVHTSRWYTHAKTFECCWFGLLSTYKHNATSYIHSYIRTYTYIP